MTARFDRVVVDASAIVALLADAGSAGQWVTEQLHAKELFAPDLMPFEVSNILRRYARSGGLDETAATLAHADLVAMPVELYPYTAVADRVWQLRPNVTAYDAAYVALAEALAVPLITLDARLGRVPGPRCQILVWES